MLVLRSIRSTLLFSESPLLKIYTAHVSRKAQAMLNDQWQTAVECKSSVVDHAPEDAEHGLKYDGSVEHLSLRGFFGAN